MHVFIDTNVLLNFFHFTKDEVDALNDVFAPHHQGAATVHLTQQVHDEFRRNREGKIKDALKKFREAKVSTQLPSFMKQYEEYEQIRTLTGQLQQLSQAIARKVEADITDKNLLADNLLKEIFEKSKPVPTTPDIYSAASMRASLGNPPGKGGSIGDAINWIVLLKEVPEGEDLHVISEDGDYYSTLNEGAPHPFLEDEWHEGKKSKLRVYRTLSSFLKEHFDGVAFAFDKDKEALIDDLADAGSFAVVHQLIAKLEQFTYFSLKEVERILAAGVTNHQFGWIVEDADVADFLRRVAVPRLGSLADAAQIELLKRVADKEAG